MDYQECTLNIRCDLPAKIFNRRTVVYEKMPGWLGFGKDGAGEEDIPYWFSYDEDQKSILVSVEPGGLLFTANMDWSEWLEWKAEFKRIATEILGFKVGEIEEGEVGHEIEWLSN